MTEKHFFTSIAELKKSANNAPTDFSLRAQIEYLQEKRTRTGDPYYEVRFTDNKNRLSLKAWSNSKAFNSLSEVAKEDFVQVEGVLKNENRYGFEADNWQATLLTPEEIQELLAGSQAELVQSKADYDYLFEICKEMVDSRLRILCLDLLEKYKNRLLRTAGARTYHHARRGALLEHSANMCRLAKGIAPVYPEINEDLLLAGVIFHDIGKMWENVCEQDSFKMPITEVAELLGHICLGVELANKLWKELAVENEDFAGKDAERMRLHLLHLIASHHGEHEFGAPVLPKTIEAFVLHHIDNIDAKVDMLRQTFIEKSEVEENIFENRRPLRQKIIATPKFQPKSEEKSEQDA